LLRLGQSLERQGKADGALTFYRRVVAEAPGTPEAATAADRINVLSDEE
jgi:TolA-binding protein